MKQNKNELDVDFIGGSAPLTKEEEKAISDYIKASKERKQQLKSREKARTANKGIAAIAGLDVGLRPAKVLTGLFYTGNRKKNLSFHG